MKILVTGSSGHLARVLLPRLCAHPEVGFVTGVDHQPGSFQHPRYAAHRLDIRAPELDALVAGCDALIHLAFVVMPGDLGRRRRDRDWIRDINLNGSRRVFEAAARHRLQRVVHLSSAAVYGAWPDNPPRIPEHHPLRPNPGFQYGEDKAELECWLDGFSARHPATAVVRLRAHAILGPNAHPLLRLLIRQPCFPSLPDPQPLTQCVREEDVADAVVAALLRDVQGPFNLAAEPALPFRDLVRHGRRFTVPLPLGLLDWVQRGLWPLTGIAGPPGWVAGLRHSLALDCGRARTLLGWEPHFSVYDCLRRSPGVPERLQP
ncbi:MAG: hypothetical protein B7Z66_01760 [Chromatiales bacterium 21-64-14]|nr:MAG: hypothetical protein B7Z66_01760 [Chromatiales bacterium 21-64-14]HQU14940.1 NAD-dependent epimerase/dehydratase family protein [Gammaproteobacteria bacterium]